MKKAVIIILVIIVLLAAFGATIFYGFNYNPFDLFKRGLVNSDQDGTEVQIIDRTAVEFNSIRENSNVNSNINSQVQTEKITNTNQELDLSDLHNRDTFDASLYKACVLEYQSITLLDDSALYLSFYDDYEVDEINMFFNQELNQKITFSAAEVGYEGNFNRLLVPQGDVIDYACSLKAYTNDYIYQVDFAIVNNNKGLVEVTQEEVEDSMSTNTNVEVKIKSNLENDTLLDLSEEYNICFYLGNTYNKKDCPHRTPLMEKGREYYDDFSRFDKAFKALIDSDFALEDDDQDGMTNFYEIVNHTDIDDPENVQTLKLSDMSALYQQYDKDFDGLKDEYESYLNLDNTRADTDGDGYEDGMEIVLGYNPTRGGAIEETTNTFLEWYEENINPISK